MGKVPILTTCGSKFSHPDLNTSGPEEKSDEVLKKEVGNFAVVVERISVR